ncbi:MAG: DUF6049 family protein [Actinomycetota bacterium]|nr:DUF6049 family protein [Actinomycetota bacterium]MDP2287346.1 DUF6049 family protein [Actinomycetota bacterium]
MRRRISLLLVWIALPFAAMICNVAPVQAAPPAVQVVLDSLLPFVPTANSELRITGRLVNTSTTTINKPVAQLRLSTGPIAGRSGIDAVLAAGELATTAVREFVIDDPLIPGGQATFSFEVAFSQLPLSKTGTYALSIDALGAGEVAIASLRTFLPWYPNSHKSTHAIGVVWLWPLADAPARTATNVLLNSDTPVSLSPGGRLANLVDVGREFSSTLTWMIDPSLVQSADDISRGYQVVKDGAIVVGNQSTDAMRWLNELRASIAPSNSRATAYADVDASAARRNGLSADVVRAMTLAQPITSSILDSAVIGGVYWTPSGRLDQRTANLLSSAGTTTVIMSTEAMAGDADQPRQGVADYPTSFGNLTAVLADSRVSATLAMPQRNASETILARQRYLAETAAIADSVTGNTQLSIVAAPTDLRWDPSPSFLRSVLRSTQSAPWMRPATMNSLVSGTRSASARLPYAAADSGELTSAYLDRVQRVQQRGKQLTAVQATPTSVNQSYSEALLRAQSSAWRSDPTTGVALVSAISRELSAQINLVRPISSGSITFSGDTGNVPVTLANDSSSTVNVGLALIGEPTSRLESEPRMNIVIEPGQKISVEMPVRVVGGDPLPTRVQILTPNASPYGVAASITLVSTAYARAAGWVVLAAFVAIAIFVVVGIARRIMQHGQPS